MPGKCWVIFFRETQFYMAFPISGHAICFGFKKYVSFFLLTLESGRNVSVYLSTLNIGKWKAVAVLKNSKLRQDWVTQIAIKRFIARSCHSASNLLSIKFTQIQSPHTLHPWKQNFEIRSLTVPIQLYFKIKRLRISNFYLYQGGEEKIPNFFIKHFSHQRPSPS